MKKSGVPRWVKVAGAWAGSVAAVIGVLSQVIPPVWGLVVGNDIDRMKADLAQCQSQGDALEEVAAAAIQASEERFVANEKHAIELRGGLENLRNEVRLRHGTQNIPPPPPPPPPAPAFGRAPAPQPAPRPTSRRETLKLLAEETDEHLSEARVKAPRQESLMDMMKKKTKKAEMLNDAQRALD